MCTSDHGQLPIFRNTLGGGSTVVTQADGSQRKAPPWGGNPAYAPAQYHSSSNKLVSSVSGGTHDLRSLRLHLQSLTEK